VLRASHCNVLARDLAGDARKFVAVVVIGQDVLVEVSWRAIDLHLSMYPSPMPGGRECARDRSECRSAS
jgi:hypothetical protein